MDEARKARGGADPNARFIVLDPNGEYANTFRDMSKVRVFAVEPSEGVGQLQIPLWFWNSAEWSAFTQASAKTQRPTLVQALRSVRDGVFGATVTPSHEMRRYLRTLVSILQLERNAGSPWGKFPQPKGFFEKLKKWQEGLASQDSFSDDEKASLSAVRDELTSLINARAGQYPTYEFTRGEVNELLSLIQSAHANFGGSDTDILPIDADVPRPFTGDQLLRSVEGTAELLGVSEYVETMQMRIRTLLSDNRMKVVSGTAQDLTLDDWLSNYIGDDVGGASTLSQTASWQDLAYRAGDGRSTHLHQALPRRRRKPELGCYLLSGIREDRPRRAQVWTRSGAVIPASKRAIAYRAVPVQQLSAAPNQQRPGPGACPQTGAGQPAWAAPRLAVFAVPPCHPAWLGVGAARTGADDLAA